MSTKFILHGGLTSTESQLNYDFFQELAKDVPEGGTILMCFFASGEKDRSDKFTELSQKITAHNDGKAYQFVQATQADFVEQLKEADAVLFNGGDANLLLKTLKGFPDLKNLFAGKTIAGSSAGAYALARYGAASSGAHMREGLGLLPLRVICHYDSPELPPSPTSVAELKAAAPELDLVILRDCEFRVVNI